jgi:hypothetical protein
MPPDTLGRSPRRDEWALAYAKQSRSDFAVFRLLSGSASVEECHRLHSLQMACEKIAKAYRFRDTDTSDERLTTEHVAFSQFIESYLGSADIKMRYRDRVAQLREVRKVARKLAREIEKLAPAVDREGTPANAEYPWEDAGRVMTPCEFTFPALALLKEAGGRTFIRLIDTAITEFENIRIH